MADEPKSRGGTLQATPFPTAPEREPESDDTRIRPQGSFPNLLDAPPELPLAPVDSANYEVGDEVARGGLGRILRAHDKRLNREVAVKVLRVRDRDAEIRFMREALITARLQHPAIVPIYEAGRWPDGEPFYAMKLLAGKSLSDIVSERGALESRLALLPNVIAVTEAIAYAHEHRVIHRDLKPATVMIGEFGETIVIDWGLAKDLDADVPDAPAASREQTPSALSHETVAGAVLGTPAYMPPEQAAGKRVDERADVYALGAVLYHVLRGSMPLDEMSPVEAMHRVLLGPLVDITDLVPDVPADLAAIVRKAMAYAPEQRYPSARELAADLRRFELGQLVSVRSYFWWERLWRWTLKRRGVMAVAAAAALSLITLATLSLQRIVEERNTALTERHQADVARAEADRRSNELVLVQAVTALERDPTAALAWLKQHPGLDALPQLRTVASDAVARGVAQHVFRAHEGRVSGIGFAAGAGTLVSAGSDGRMLAFDLKSGASSQLLAPPGVLWVLSRSADGSTFAVAGSGNQVRLVSPGSPDRLLEHDGSTVLALELAPDGKQLAAGTVAGKVWLWDVATGQRRELQSHPSEIRDLAFSPGGGRLASASWDGVIQVHNLAGGETKTIRAHSGELWAIDYSSDGRLLASGGADGTVKLWDAAGELFAELKGHQGSVVHLAFSPDGTRLATASRDDAVRVWDAPFKTGRALEGHGADVLRVAFSPDGKMLASGSADMTVRLWSMGSTDVRVLGGHEASVHALAFSPDGQRLASAGQDGSVRVWNVATAGARAGPSLGEVVVSPLGTARCGVAPDGQLQAVDATGASHVLAGTGWRFAAFVTEDRIVAEDGNRDVITWEPGTGQSRTLGRLPVDIGSAVLASGWLVVGAFDGTVRLWRLSDGLEKTWRAHPTYTLGLAVTPDGRTVASSGEEGVIKLWDVASGESRELKGHVGPVHQVRFSADGALLASGDMNGGVRVWKVATGGVVGEDKHRGFVRTVAFSRDGAKVASGGDGKTVRVLELASLRSVQLEGFGQSVFDVAFSEDGALVAASSADQTVRVFDLQSGAAHVLRGQRGTVGRVLFQGKDATLLTTDGSGAVRRFSAAEYAPLPGTRDALEKWLDAASSVRIAADHRPASLE